MLHLNSTTANLQAVIELHKIEIIRQELVINAQTVQSHLYSFGTSFGPELDVIVDNVIKLDDSSRKCLQCHHDETMTLRLKEVTALVDQYQDSLSALITTTANKQRIESLRAVTIGIGDTILQRSEEMSAIAGNLLKKRTEDSLNEINRSRIILLTTLFLSSILALIIAATMTRQITEPIYELVEATRHIQDGELGYTTSTPASGEFAELVDSFNQMSVSLNKSNKQVKRNIASLSNLYKVTLTFHSITNATDIFRELARGTSDLVGADQVGLMLIEEDEFVHQYPAAGLDMESTKKLRFPKDVILKLYEPSKRHAYIANEMSSDSPSAATDAALNVRNFMFVWIRQKGEIIGLIRVANKRTGDFTSEDVQPIAILANNVSVALENAKLYNDLRMQMKQIKDAQEQLIQAAKLVAIGELSSNVAHELNNPLTTILGYIDLMLEEATDNEMVRDLEVMKNECLRSKGITRQLLEFARKRPLNKQVMDVSKPLKEAISLMEMQTKSSKVNIVTEFGSDLVITGDENQLKQVYLNIINNAIHAMDAEGTLTISTGNIADKVLISFKDTGHGIDTKHLNRIFEPFFSTKQEKGTGIGLSVSYKIIQSHDGTIEVESTKGKGTTFTVALPKG